MDLDILDKDAVLRVLQSVKPDVIYNLAAQSSVELSWKKADLTVDINIKGALNVLEAVRMLDYSPRVLLIGSSEEYGKVKQEDCPIKETYEPNPQNVYAITKLTQNRLGKLYADAYNVDVVMTRAFNHIGVGQLGNFVVPSFCEQIANILKKQQKPKILTGNLSAKRDFTVVKHIVKAYVLLVQKGLQGETYNVGSGRAVSLDSILKILVKISGVDAEICVDPQRFRPVDVPVIEADITKLYTLTNWKPGIPLERTLEEVLKWKMG